LERCGGGYRKKLLEPKAVVTVILVVFIGSVILVLPVGSVIHVGGIVRDGNTSRARQTGQVTGPKIGDFSEDSWEESLGGQCVGELEWKGSL
jgi:hypothetical protein